jgi:alpha 1,3-mannosyltransferase
MFTPKKQPLKEGRSYPGGLPYPGPSGRSLKPKQALLILVVICLIPIYLFYSSTSSALSSIPSSNTQSPAKSDPQVVVKDPPRPAAEIPVAKPASNQAPFRAPEKNDELLNDEEPINIAPSPGKSKGYGATTDQESASSKGKSSAVTSTKVGWTERPSFEKALARVVNLLPGEMHMRDLLRPVEGTGKERLREMGLRTRAYKSYFEAWEDLHLDTDAEGGTYVRDDVVQYIRSHSHDSAVGAGIEGLETMDLAQQIRAYESYRYFLAKFGQMLFPWTWPYFSDHMSLHAHFKRGGRGIVLTAGDDQAPYLLTSIPIMRELGCTLPVEVMYLGDSDLSEDFRSELEALDGVITRDIAQMVNDEGWRLAGWAGKPFAILFSSFREVIFIDADSLFFKNPEVLFDDPDYQKTGALFFKDRLIMPENKKRFLQQILPKPISRQVKQSRFWTGEAGHMQESGVVVVDKWRHFMAMLLITRMNGPDRDGNKDEGRIGVYDLVYGECCPPNPRQSPCAKANPTFQQATKKPSG